MSQSAPRVTNESIENAIVAEYWLHPASDLQEAPIHDSLQTLTICILVLKNGFTVTGESNCVSPANYDIEIGRRVARENAKQKIWALEGYALRNQLAQ